MSEVATVPGALLGLLVSLQEALLSLHTKDIVK